MRRHLSRLSRSRPSRLALPGASRFDPMGTAMMEKEPQDGRIGTPPVGRKKTKPFSRDGTDHRLKVLEIAPRHNEILYQIRSLRASSFRAIRLTRIMCLGKLDDFDIFIFQPRILG